LAIREMRWAMEVRPEGAALAIAHLAGAAGHNSRISGHSFGGRNGVDAGVRSEVRAWRARLTVI
jgi:hypothetical protein